MIKIQSSKATDNLWGPSGVEGIGTPPSHVMRGIEQFPEFDREMLFLTFSLI